MPTENATTSENKERSMGDDYTQGGNGEGGKTGAILWLLNNVREREKNKKNIGNAGKRKKKNDTTSNQERSRRLYRRGEQ